MRLMRSMRSSRGDTRENTCLEWRTREHRGILKGSRGLTFQAHPRQHSVGPTRRFEAGAKIITPSGASLAWRIRPWSPGVTFILRGRAVQQIHGPRLELGRGPCISTLPYLLGVYCRLQYSIACPCKVRFRAWEIGPRTIEPMLLIPGTKLTE